MVKKNVLELWSIFKERLSPPDLKTLTSLLIDSNRRRIDKTQLIASALLLFKNDEFLHRCFTDFLHDKESQEAKDGETQSVEEGEIRARDRKADQVCVRNKEEAMVSDRLQEDEKTHQNVEDDQEGGIQEDEETQSDEEGETREERDSKTDDQVCVRDKESTTPTKESERKVRVRVSDEGELEKLATNVFRLEGNGRIILKPEPPKKTRTSRRLERVTPSYQTIPEEEQCPVSNKVLNSKYSAMHFHSGSGKKKLSKYQEAIERCEDEMFETDMTMEALKSAVESAEKVIREEMSVEDLGVQFYRCIEVLYRRDMFAIVREDHMTALPVILNRLKQKLDELTVSRERREVIWKQAFEENTAKQREATAQQGRRKK